MNEANINLKKIPKTFWEVKAISIIDLLIIKEGVENMKKNLLTMLMFLLILTCMISAVFATEVKTIKIADFEDSTLELVTFADSGSKITPTYTTDIFQEGKQSVLVEARTANWAGVVLILEGDKADWSGMTTFKMWVYGSESKKRFDVQFEDKDGELFLENIKDDFAGWKQFVFKINEIKPRKDYQDPKAKLNKIIDYPLKTLQFCTTNSGSGGSGKLQLYFDNFEVTNE